MDRTQSRRPSLLCSMPSPLISMTRTWPNPDVPTTAASGDVNPVRDKSNKYQTTPNFPRGCTTALPESHANLGSQQPQARRAFLQLGPAAQPLLLASKPRGRRSQGTLSSPGRPSSATLENLLTASSHTTILRAHLIIQKRAMSGEMAQWVKAQSLTT